MDPLQELVADRDIRRLVAVYAHRADDGDGQGFADLFAENGMIVLGVDRIEGRDAIREWLLGTRKLGALRHLMVNHAITVNSAEEATGSVDMALIRQHAGAWSVYASPRYADRYVKTAGGWRFAERQVSK